MGVREAESGMGAWLRNRWPRDIVFLGVALGILAFDQITKSLVRENLLIGESWPEDWAVQFTHVINTGAAFGILEGKSGFLVVTSVIGLAAIVFYYWFPPHNHPIVPVAFGMLLGGTLGNLIDRLRLGHVTDFVDFPHYPAFNVADSSIVISIVVLLGMTLLMPPHPNNQRQ